MKTKLLSICIILALILSLVPSTALAGAYETNFITAITYQNVDTLATTDLRAYFYESPSDTTPIEIILTNLAAGASTSLFIGSLAQLGSDFQGTALMTSDKQLVATLVQLPQGSATVKNRPLSNGFTSGTGNTLLATVVKNSFGYHTIFSVQNAGSTATDVTINFYNTSAAIVDTISTNIQPGAGYFVDASTRAALGASFSGSVVISSVGGELISSAMELETGLGVGARAFEGLGQGSDIFYMPSALCNFLITGNPTNTNYAVQNTNLSSSTVVTVTYSNGATQSANIGAGAKASFNTCAASGMTQNFNGSATITSSVTDIIAVGKVAGNGLTTAFVGSSSGASRLALPYVRWATTTNFNAGTQQRVNIAIQNVGGSTITGDILVHYVDKFGTTLGTHTINTDLAAGSKANSNATNAGLTEFGVYGDGSFGGGVIIEGPVGSQVAAVARVTSRVVATGLTAGEDYNAFSLP